MPSIFIATIVTALFSLVFIGALILKRAPKHEWPVLLLAVAAYVPIYWAAYYWLRLPLDAWLHHLLEKDVAVYGFLKNFYAPLTEEPGKWTLLLLPWFRNRINEKNFVRVAMAVGLGFGIGEMGLLAKLINVDPTLPVHPWYAYGGFMSERFLVCFAHGALMAIMLKYFKTHLIGGMLGALSFHFLVNFPIYLSRIDLFGLGANNWQMILLVWEFASFVIVFLVLTYFAAGNFELGKFLMGSAKCPKCGFVFPRRIWGGFNLGIHRYERCPACKKWGFTTTWKEPGS